MVRATDKAKAILKRCASSEHKPQTVILEEALEAYERMRFCEDLRNGYSELRKDKRAWKEFKGETEAWDATMADGLPEEPADK